ncbi:MAG: hypothetical protein MJE68_26355, partial [Proteobacteria bacterium]|nr:hypothetical protein [Pseudomonadota bacterium]
MERVALSFKLIYSLDTGIRYSRPLQMGIQIPILASCILHVGGQPLPLTIIMNLIMSTTNIIKILYPTTVHVHTRRAWIA